LFRNLISALILRERIQTTLAKAKELRSKAEKVITLGKKGTVHARRMALRHVAERETLKKLFGVLSERYAKRNGGYTRIIKIGNRLGDDAPMAFLELVDREEEKPKTETKGKAQKSSAPKKDSADKKPAKNKEGKAKEPKSEKSAKKPAKKADSSKEK
jgi:large subunit ribosomal protein L17